MKKGSCKRIKRGGCLCRNKRGEVRIVKKHRCKRR